MPQNRGPKVRVGIVSWNTADLLGRCLDALPAALGELDAEIVVVDNDSGDGSLAVAQARPNVVAIANDSNTGYAKGMNLALAERAGAEAADVLIALNPDTEPGPGSLEALVNRLWADPTVGLVVPRLLNAIGELQHSAYLFPSPAVAGVVSFVPPRLQRGAIGRHWWLEGAHPHDTPTDIDWAIGAVHVLRAEAAKQVAHGPAYAAGEQSPAYSERWFMYVEDLDLCWRLREGGWRIRLEADVAVPHVGNAAGAQAWGSSRNARWLRVTYDWYGAVHGDAAARRLAAMNVAGAGVHALTRGIRSHTGPQRAISRMVADDLRQALAIHRDVARRGPSQPLEPSAPTPKALRT